MHRALGEQCETMSDDDVALHDPRRVVPHLGKLGLLKLLVPPFPQYMRIYQHPERYVEGQKDSKSISRKTVRAD
jgi:hypothetical protein